TATSLDLSGLGTSTSYSYRVEPCNAQRCGKLSSASDAVTPYTTPGTPGVTWHKSGAQDGYFTVSAPSSDGGDAIDQYQWRLYRNGEQTRTGTETSPYRVDVNPGYSVTFKLETRAHNRAGWGAWASDSGRTEDPPP